jgi:hypothetical protein
VLDVSEAAIADVLAALPAGVTDVEILGDGPLASALRLRMGAPGRPAQVPAAIVETTGHPASIALALSRVADLGTVVLAGAVSREPAALDLYADLHVRGLTLVGVGEPP